MKNTIHTTLHSGPEWHIFHILNGEDVDDVISRTQFFLGRLTLVSMK